MSHPRYLPPDTDLRALLDVLQEECAEVIIAASKLKRFGEAPTDPATGIAYNNVIDLHNEMSDVERAWHRVQQRLLLS